MTVCGNKLSGVCGACTLFNICRNNEIANLPKSNIEWMREASLEELAEAILQQWIHGAYHGVGEFGLTDKEIESARDGIIEWLKEKRDESV